MEETQITVSYPDAEFPVFRVREGNKVYNVHSYLYKLKSADVKLNEENTEFRWIAPSEAKKEESVGGLCEVIEGFSDLY